MGVLKFVDDTFLNVKQACTDIEESVSIDLMQIIGDTFDAEQLDGTVNIQENVVHACDYVIKAFKDITQEMRGFEQFVHPDNEMVERLQKELITVYQELESVRNAGSGNVRK